MAPPLLGFIQGGDRLSAYLMGRVFYTELPSYLKLTLLALADVAEDDGSRVMLGQARLARKVGCTDRSIRAHLTALRDLGHIEKVGRLGSHGQDRYQIIVGSLPSHEQIALLFKGARPDAADRPETDSDRRPSVPSTGDPASLDRKLLSDDSSVTHQQDSSEKVLAPTTSTLPSTVTAIEARRPPDDLFEAMFEVWIGQPYTTEVARSITGAARGKLNAACGQLRTAGATAEQIHRIPAAWNLMWQGANPPTFTPNAAAAHWPALVAAMERGYVARGNGQGRDEKTDRMVREITEPRTEFVPGLGELR